MKKTTIYTLLCTTILTSGISLATEKKDIMGTPSRVAQLKGGSNDPSTPVSSLRAQVLSIPETPPVSTLEKNYSLSEYSPTGANYEAQREAKRIHMQNELEKKKLTIQADQIEYGRKLKAVREEEEAAREKALQERRVELEREAEEKNSILEAEMIDRLQQEKERSKQALEKIMSQITVLKLEATQAKELATTQEQAAKSSSEVVDKLKIKVKDTREQALLDMQIRDQMIETLELEAEKERVANHQAQIEIERLKEKNKTFEKLLKVKAPTIGSSAHLGISGTSPLLSGEPNVVSNGSLSGVPSLSPSLIPNVVSSISLGDGATSTPNLQLQPQVDTSTPSVSSASVVVKKKKVVEKEEGAVF